MWWTQKLGTEYSFHMCRNVNISPYDKFMIVEITIIGNDDFQSIENVHNRDYYTLKSVFGIVKTVSNKHL